MNRLFVALCLVIAVILTLYYATRPYSGKRYASQWLKCPETQENGVRVPLTIGK